MQNEILFGLGDIDTVTKRETQEGKFFEPTDGRHLIVPLAYVDFNSLPPELVDDPNIGSKMLQRYNVMRLFLDKDKLPKDYEGEKGFEFRLPYGNRRDASSYAEVDPISWWLNDFDNHPNDLLSRKYDPQIFKGKGIDSYIVFPAYFVEDEIVRVIRLKPFHFEKIRAVVESFRTQFYGSLFELKITDTGKTTVSYSLVYSKAYTGELPEEALHFTIDWSLPQYGISVNDIERRAKFLTLMVGEGNHPF